MEVAQKWTLPWVPQSAEDSLLRALLWILAYHDCFPSQEQLIAGLPLEGGFLNPELCIRAAQRAHCRALFLKRALKDISPLLCPVILFLNHKQACILKKIEGDEATLVLCESTQHMCVSLDLLAEHYQGGILLVTPKVRLDERTQTQSLATEEHWFWSVLKKTVPIYGDVLIASFFINTFTVATSLFTMNVYDRVIPNQALETLWVLTFGIGIVYGFDFLLKVLRAYFIDVAGKKADILLSSSIYEHMMGIKMAQRPPSVGSFANTVHQFEAFREFFTSATMATFIDLPFALFFVMIIAWIGGVMALVPGIAIPVVVLVVFYLQKPLYATIKESYRYTGQKHAQLVETLTGIESLKTANAESLRQTQWEQLVLKASQLSMKSKFWAQLAIQFSGFIQQAAQAGVIVIGVYQIIGQHMTVGALMACTLLTSRALLPLAQLTNLLTRYQQAISSLKGLDDIMHLECENRQETAVIADRKVSGAIVFQDVSFSYPGQKEAALTVLNFSINPGEKVAILGKIGSGKSTIEKLLLRLYEPQAGHILLDGMDLRHLNAAYLRAHIGYCPQDIMCFFGSIKDNILLGQFQEDQEALIRASYLAGVTDFVALHAEGFDRSVGERGTRLSGGQRQAVVLARALVKDSPLLLLDEPTSMMDPQTEQRVLHRLKTVVESKTILLVTHKVSVLSLVERVIVMDNGRIIADGPREDIVRRLAAPEVPARA
jgi:ATP-binding cassette, subfamily C, bacterial LapB